MRRGRVSIVLLTLVVGSWSLALGVLGFWLLFEPHRGLLSNSIVAISAGVICLSASQFVFLFVAADRVFPGTTSSVKVIAQTGNLLILVLSLGVLISASLIASV